MRESEVKEEFAEGINNKCDGNEHQCGLKRKLLDVASKVCGYTKNKPRHFETWLWDKDVDVAVCRAKDLFRIWKQSLNEEDRKKYCEAKKKLREQLAMDQKARKAVQKVDSCRDGRELFRIAKQRVGEMKDGRVSSLKNESGAVNVSVND